MNYPGFVGPSYTLQNVSADCQRCINLYPQPDESGAGKSRAILLSTPGLVRLADVSATAAGGVRGTYTASNDRIFAVAGATLFEFSNTWAVLGTYPLPGEVGATRVSMTDNGRDMMIATGPNGYWFNFAASTLTQIADAVFFGATMCGFIDGYIVFNQPNSQVFWITNIYSTVINPLGFASAEGNPDNLLALLVDHREIWLFGDVSTEVWYDSGNANFPFSAIQGAYISHGIAAPYSAQRLDNTTFWLGNDEFGQGIVWRANGYSPMRISNFAFEQAMQRYPTIADATSWTYQQDGHSFYVLNFPSGDATWVYDAATGMWHERAYLGRLAANDGQLHRGRPETHSFAFGKHVVGDWETGYLYQLTPLAFNDDTREIKRLRRAPFINNEHKRIFFYQFQLDMEVGQGNPGAESPPPAAITYLFTQHNVLPYGSVFGATFSGMHTDPIKMFGPSVAGDEFTFWANDYTEAKLFMTFYSPAFAVLSSTNVSAFVSASTLFAPANTAWVMMSVEGGVLGGIYNSRFQRNPFGPLHNIETIQFGCQAVEGNFFRTIWSAPATNFYPIAAIVPGVQIVTTLASGQKILFYDAAYNIIETDIMNSTVTAPIGTVYFTVQLVGAIGNGVYDTAYQINGSGGGTWTNKPVDPQIILRWSDDGGYTWSNEKQISMGKSGEYRKRVVWRRLGNARQRVFEVSTGQSNMNLSLYDAYLELAGVNV